MIILSPTRELAQQIQKVVLALGDYMSVQCHCCIGGTNVGEDIRKLDYGQVTNFLFIDATCGSKLTRHFPTSTLCRGHPVGRLT